MKADQIAVYCSTERSAGIVKDWLGLRDVPWVCDTVTAKGTVYGQEVTNIAELQFCYALGMEFEIIRYTHGAHWCAKHINAHAFPFFSHLGFHLDAGEDWPRMQGAHLVQEVKTIGHTNPDLLASGKRYHYRIYEAGPGTYFKFIKRLERK